jgi:hypothetical protein
MRTKFLIFFSLTTLAAILAIVNSLIIQSQVYGKIDFGQDAFKIALVGWILYLLWRRSGSGYVLALAYTISVSMLYGYELALYFGLGNMSAKLPTGAAIVSALLILATISALILFGLDYLDYRKHRVPIDQSL